MVTTAAFSASFEIEAGEVTRCAPILRRRIAYWKRTAVWLGPVTRESTAHPIPSKSTLNPDSPRAGD